MKYILVLDQGTTSTRAIIFDEKSNVVAKAQEEFPQIYPKPGYVEHDSMDILSSARGVISTAIARAKIKYSEIATMGITNQRETVIMWNRETGDPVYHAIVWQCRRTAEYCEELIKTGHEELIYSKTGLKIDPYFSATKIKWLFDNVPTVKELYMENKLCIGTIDTYLMWALSGGKIYCTDYTNASRTMLFNIHKMKWDKELCDLFGVPIDALPEIHPSGYFYGYTNPEILGCKLAICGVAGDQQCSLFGQMCTSKGQLKITYGTGCFLLMNTADEPVKSQNGLLTTLACSFDDKPIYALEGSVFIAGSLVRWLRDELELIENAAETEKIAKSVDDSCGVVIVPAFVGLGAPYWDSSVRGLITGLTRGANKRHIIRAALEAIAFQVYDVVEAMKKDSLTTLEVIRVDGGACINDFLMQFQADILNQSIFRPQNVEVTALGSAFLAGLTIGVWNSVEEIYEITGHTLEFKPNMTAKTRNQLLDNWHSAVRQALINKKSSV